MLTGVGGRVNPDEMSRDAMRREFRAKVGVDVPIWSPLAVMNNANWMIDFYYAFSEDLPMVKPDTDESCRPYDVSWAVRSTETVAHLRWLIPLALDTSGVFKPIVVMVG
jgi:ADP-ribose pyrophosphatase YjhB (NUDIX family)